MRRHGARPALQQPSTDARHRQQFLIILLWFLLGLLVDSNGDVLLAQERTRRVRGLGITPRWGGTRARDAGPLVAAACY